MKVYVNENAPMTNRVLVADDEGNTAYWSIDQTLSLSLQMARSAHAAGEVVPLGLFANDAHLLGHILEDDVELDCPLLLVGYEGQQYYLVCGPDMRTLSAVERYLVATIGTAEVELWPVCREHMSAILKNHFELSKVAPRVTLVLGEGGVIHAETLGIPKHVSVKVYKVADTAGDSFGEGSAFGRLTVQGSRVLENVEELQVELRHMDSPELAAVFGTN